jgi:hypothetical protein
MFDAPCLALAQRCCSSTLCVMLLLFVQHYCPSILIRHSLFNIIVHPILVQRCCSSHPCLTFLLLLSLLNATNLRSFLNVVAISFLSRCCYSSCPYLTLLFLHSLLDAIVVVCLFNVDPPFSLLDIVAFVLFVQLYYSFVLAQHYYSSLLARHCNWCAPCSMLWFLRSLFVFNIACSHSSTSLLHRDVVTLMFLFPCSMLMLLYSLLNVIVPVFLVSNWYFPLVFLHVGGVIQIQLL